MFCVEQGVEDAGDGRLAPGQADVVLESTPDGIDRRTITPAAESVRGTYDHAVDLRGQSLLELPTPRRTRLLATQRSQMCTVFSEVDRHRHPEAAASPCIRPLTCCPFGTVRSKPQLLNAQLNAEHPPLLLTAICYLLTAICYLLTANC